MKKLDIDLKLASRVLDDQGAVACLNESDKINEVLESGDVLLRVTRAEVKSMRDAFEYLWNENRLDDIGVHVFDELWALHKVSK